MATSSALSTPSTMLSMKRKRDGTGRGDGRSSKKKKDKRAKQIIDDVRDSGKRGGIDESISKMDGRLLADFFAQQAKRHNDDLSAVELNDICVPGEMRFQFFSKLCHLN